MTPEDNLAAILKDIEKHPQALVRFNYAQIREEAFKSETEERAFELTGVKTRDEICTELKIGSKTLIAFWNKWFELGLLVKESNDYNRLWNNKWLLPS